MKTTFAPPLATSFIFSAWRFICQQFGSPFQAVGVTARIAPKADTAAKATVKQVMVIVFTQPLYHNRIAAVNGESKWEFSVTS